MVDSGKVLRALKQHLLVKDGEECVDCPYGEMDGLDCVRQLYRDVEELLKAHEPRVLSLEEVLGGDECWFEYINGSFGYADVVMQDNTTALIYRTIVGTGEVPISDYDKKWRCWSYGPTAEQRKAVKWNAAD